MFFTSWLRWFDRKFPLSRPCPATGRRRRGARFRPVLLPLEMRCLPTQTGLLPPTAIPYSWSSFGNTTVAPITLQDYRQPNGAANGQTKPFHADSFPYRGPPASCGAWSNCTLGEMVASFAHKRCERGSDPQATAVPALRLVSYTQSQVSLGQ